MAMELASTLRVQLMAMELASMMAKKWRAASLVASTKGLGNAPMPTTNAMQMMMASLRLPEGATGGRSPAKGAGGLRLRSARLAAGLDLGGRGRAVLNFAARPPPAPHFAM
jgi:hypothetical protein